MYSWIMGKIAKTSPKTIELENNYISYTIHVANECEYEIGKVKRVYIYKFMFQDNKNHIIEELYGFTTNEQKQMFIDLLNVTGIGPKTAIQICKVETNKLKKMITGKHVKLLAKTAKIGERVADNICDELNYKVEERTETEKDLIKALRSLGYNTNDIELALSKASFKTCFDLCELISRAIKVIAKSERK